MSASSSSPKSSASAAADVKSQSAPAAGSTVAISVAIQPIDVSALEAEIIAMEANSTADKKLLKDKYIQLAQAYESQIKEAVAKKEISSLNLLVEKMGLLNDKIEALIPKATASNKSEVEPLNKKLTDFKIIRMIGKECVERTKLEIRPSNDIVRDFVVAKANIDDAVQSLELNRAKLASISRVNSSNRRELFFTILKMYRLSGDSNCMEHYRDAVVDKRTQIDLKEHRDLTQHFHVQAMIALDDKSYEGFYRANKMLDDAFKSASVNEDMRIKLEKIFVGFMRFRDKDESFKEYYPLDQSQLNILYYRVGKMIETLYAHKTNAKWYEQWDQWLGMDIFKGGSNREVSMVIRLNYLDKMDKLFNWNDLLAVESIDLEKGPLQLGKEKAGRRESLIQPSVVFSPKAKPAASSRAGATPEPMRRNSSLGTPGSAKR